MNGPIERKVQASTVAAAISGLVLWALGTYVFKGNVPDVVTSWVYALVPAGITFAAGYLAKHTARPMPTSPELKAALASLAKADIDPKPPAAP
jgi:hypothetical protein